MLKTGVMLAAAAIALAGCKVDRTGGAAGPAAIERSAPSAGSGSPPPAVATEREAEVAAMFEDPAFKKQFVGSYGINAEIEPRLQPADVILLEKIRPLMADNLPAAEAMLKEQMKPEGSAILDFTLGGIQFQQDRLPDAHASFQAAVSKFPSFRRAWRNLGLIHVREGRHDDAIKAFTRMVELGGGDGYAFGLLGFAYASKQDYQPAEASYRNALLLQPENTEWRLGLTRCVFKQEKYEDAATLLDALLERYPEKADFWLLQAQTYLGMKQPLKAAENLEMVDRLGKGTVDSLHLLGDIYVSENLMEPAVRAYERAIGIDAKQPPARPLRSAEVLCARGAMPEARRLTSHIRKTWPADLEDADRRKLLMLEARISSAEGGESAATLKILEEIVSLDPLDGEALLLLGDHHAKASEPDRAILYFERAAGIEAFEVNAKVRHAQVLVGQARYAEAIPLLRRAQELKPRETIARYLEEVERVAKSRK